jgi:hypothetical protein
VNRPCIRRVSTLSLVLRNVNECRGVVRFPLRSALALTKVPSSKRQAAYSIRRQERGGQERRTRHALSPYTVRLSFFVPRLTHLLVQVKPHELVLLHP